jgi:hypothetical protein
MINDWSRAQPGFLRRLRACRTFSEKAVKGLNKARMATISPCTYGHRFQNTDRHPPLLLPPDLRDWVAEDDLVHFILQAVDRLPLSAFAVNHKGTSDAQYPPHTMLALLLYCYANGIFGSRRRRRWSSRGSRRSPAGCCARSA